MGIHHDLGVGTASNLVEHDRGNLVPDLRESAGRGSEIRLELHFVLDTQELTLLLEHREKLTKILVAFHQFALLMKLCWKSARDAWIVRLKAGRDRTRPDP